MDTFILLGTFFAPLLIAVIAKASGVRGIRKSNGETSLFTDLPTRIVVSYFGLIPIGFFLLDPKKTWAGSLLVAIPAGYIVLDAWVTKIRITKDGIHSRSPWRRTKFIAWDEITSVGRVSNGGGWKWDYINTARNGKVRWGGLIDGAEHIEWALNKFAKHAPRVSSSFLEK
jgi:hypothetical protein